MLQTREAFEEREKNNLAPYAAKSVNSQGRDFSEAEDPYRTCFQRDRDRVIHCKAFRRLKGKTQVFVAHYGDHYRSRLTHSMEVAQLSRDIARMLNLNEDLAETIALAHDLGHTPFGHAGQEAMNELMQEHGKRFEHNEQSRRVVEFLEDKKPEYRGLNLTFEVRDGLIKHRTPYDHPPETDTLMPSLEAQIVNIADEIAYQNHDIDDGLRAGILKEADFEKLEIWQMAKRGINHKASADHRIRAMISGLITLMINDVAQNTDRLIKEFGIHSLEEVCRQKKPMSGFSDDFAKRCVELKTFLHRHFYRSPGVMEYNEKGKEVIRFLFRAIQKNPSLLPEKVRQNPHGEDEFVLIKDYIAGMTDAFAMSLYKELQ